VELLLSSFSLPVPSSLVKFKFMLVCLTFTKSLTRHFGTSRRHVSHEYLAFSRMTTCDDDTFFQVEKCL
jgi:hypothetical protein